MVIVKKQVCEWDNRYVRCTPVTEEGEVIGRIYFEARVLSRTARVLGPLRSLVVWVYQDSRRDRRQAAERLWSLREQWRIVGRQPGKREISRWRRSGPVV